jgi:hypothetical protein
MKAREIAKDAFGKRRVLQIGVHFSTFNYVESHIASSLLLQF